MLVYGTLKWPNFLNNPERLTKFEECYYRTVTWNYTIQETHTHSVFYLILIQILIFVQYVTCVKIFNNLAYHIMIIGCSCSMTKDILYNRTPAMRCVPYSNYVSYMHTLVQTFIQHFKFVEMSILALFSVHVALDFCLDLQNAICVYGNHNSSCLTWVNIIIG